MATTSRDLGNSLFMLHVKKYLDYKRTFYESLEGQAGSLDSAYEFSVIDASKAYDGVKEISAKIVNVVWLCLMNTGILSGFGVYMKSLATEKTTNISWDATHSYAEKGKTIINNQRIATMKSLSVIVCNQNYIQSAVFTLSHRNVELQNQFEAFAQRLDDLQLKRRNSCGIMLYGRNIIEKVGTDYTEKYGAMLSKVFPSCKHAQDVYHWIVRFRLGIMEGKKNQDYHEVIASLSIAWRESQTRIEIISNFTELYTKYHNKGGIWNALAKDLFERQMERVNAGWLDKNGDSANTSRVENKFRHIETVQASFVCSLQLFEGLGLAKIDAMNRSNGLRLHDPLMIQTNGYCDVVYSNQIQKLESSLFPYKRTLIATLPETINTNEKFGVLAVSTQLNQVPRESAEENDLLVEECDEVNTDYLPQAIANDFLEQCELESLGLDAAKRNDPEKDLPPPDYRYTPISQLLEECMPPTLPAETTQAHIPYQPPRLTATMQWLQRRTGIAPENFVVGEGEIYHLFMQLRRREKWRSAPNDTNFRAAELSWRKEIDAYHVRFPDEQRLPLYDAVTLRNKCIEIEKNLPKFLMYWEKLDADGIEVHANRDGIDCNVKKKIKYWKAQDLRENILPTPASSRGKIDICKRCNMQKVHGSGHGTRTCTDGVLINADNEIIRFPQPTDLFITKEGLLDQERFFWLVQHSRTNPLHDTETMHFAILARNILNADGTLNQVRLAALKIGVATAEAKDSHTVWRKAQTERAERERKRARANAM